MKNWAAHFHRTVERERERGLNRVCPLALPTPRSALTRTYTRHAARSLAENRPSLPTETITEAAILKRVRNHNNKITIIVCYAARAHCSHFCSTGELFRTTAVVNETI